VGKSFPDIKSLLTQLEVWKNEYDTETFREIWVDAGYALNMFDEQVGDVMRIFKAKMYEISRTLPDCNSFQRSTTWKNNFQGFKNAYDEINRRRVERADEKIQREWGNLGTLIFNTHASQGYHRSLGRLVNKVPDMQTALDWLNLAIYHRITEGGPGTRAKVKITPIDVENVLNWLKDNDENPRNPNTPTGWQWIEDESEERWFRPIQARKLTVSELSKGRCNTPRMDFCSPLQRVSYRYLLHRR
jgi:hypothetical protein